MVGLMKIVIHRAWGSINTYIGEHRTDPQVIAWIEEGNLPEEILDNGYFIETAADYEVAEIPDEATDYYVDDYDGMEDIFFVIDGKIFKGNSHIGEM